MINCKNAIAQQAPYFHVTGKCVSLTIRSPASPSPSSTWSSWTCWTSPTTRSPRCPPPSPSSRPPSSSSTVTRSASSPRRSASVLGWKHWGWRRTVWHWTAFPHLCSRKGGLLILYNYSNDLNFEAQLSYLDHPPLCDYLCLISISAKFLCWHWRAIYLMSKSWTDKKVLTSIWRDIPRLRGKWTKND